MQTGPLKRPCFFLDYAKIIDRTRATRALWLWPFPVIVIDDERVRMRIAVGHVRVVFRQVIVIVRYHVFLILRAPDPLAHQPGYGGNQTQSDERSRQADACPQPSRERVGDQPAGV